MTDIHISGPAGQVQVRPLWQDSDKVAVICHPHPLMGGTMDNKVVTTLARFFRNHGCSVVLFNFRGAGTSSGQHDHGIGEIDDLFSVLDWVASQMTARQLYLAGFSFGGYIAASGCARLLGNLSLNGDNSHGYQLRHLYLVAPAVEHYPMADLMLPADTLVLIGTEDDVVSPQAMRTWANVKHLDLVEVTGSGHFFHGHLPEIGLALERRFP